RVGMHTGEGVLSDGHYVGIDVHRAARIASAGHGGQILASAATRALVEHDLPIGSDLQDLGVHRLKDIEEPEHLYPLLVDGLADSFPPIRSLSARLSNLPDQRTSFVGREDAVRQATDLFEGVRLLTLTGPGGTGKTRLALKIAADQIGRFADGVYLADLSSITDPAFVPQAIAVALMVREQPGRDVLDSLTDHLRERELLLVLDNVEQVIQAASAVGRLIDHAPRLKVLATSRVPLHLTGEQEFPVPTMTVPEPTGSSDLDALASNEAVMLFTQRAAAVRPGFRLSADNAFAIAQIAIKLDGLPLALELAASRAKLLAPDAILGYLGARLSLLSTGARDVPDRQRTLRRTIEWSHDLLEPEHQRLFARLATFSGGWTLAAAERVCEPKLGLNVLDGLATLVDHSMVLVGTGDGEPRFQMLETIREFAVERLAMSGEGDQLRRAHAEHFRDVAEEAERHQTREDRIVWLATLEQEHDNLRSALDWSEGTGDAETALRTAAAIWRFWLQRGHLSEGRSRLVRLLAMGEVDVSGPVRVRSLAALGGLAYWQSDPAATRQAYEEAVGVARELGDPKLLASALLDLSYVPYLEGKPEDVQPILEEGLAWAEESGDRVLLAQFINSTAFLDVDRGNPAAAIRPFQTAIAMLQEEGATWKAADLLTGLGYITRTAGDLQAAKNHFRDALAVFAKARDALSMSMVFNGLALVANEEGSPERAARLIGASARMRSDVGGNAPLIGRWGDPEADARRVLGADAYDSARGQGYAMDMDAMVAYANQDGD
ncbi:MAG TPA: NB-ARC domain-containing protein, partial [Gemmatimonadales bacterium]